MQLSVATLNLTDGEDGAERSVILALLSNEPLVLAQVGGAFAAFAWALR